MKIKIECTVEFDKEVIKQLMQKRLLADSDETIQYFIKSHFISMGAGVFSEALFDANLPDAFDVIKTNI